MSTETEQRQLTFYTRGDLLKQRFDRFHAKNPFVYEILIRLTREWLARNRGRGAARLGIGMVYEVARWEIVVSTRTDGDTFKLSNDHRAFYVRKIIIENPDLEGVFTLRRQRAYDHPTL